MVVTTVSNIRHIRQIYVLDRGHLAGAGTHEKLLAEGGLYAGPWRVQTGEASEVEVA